MKTLLPLVAAICVVLALATRPASAAELTLELSTSAAKAKAKVGDDVTYSVRVENNGAETITDLRISLALPDALDAQSVSGPGTGETVTDLLLFALAPGESVDVVFVVRVGTRLAAVNGDVTATASRGGVVLSSASLPKLKIVGPRR